MAGFFTAAGFVGGAVPAGGGGAADCHERLRNIGVPGVKLQAPVSGFKQPIDDAEWTITTLTHSVMADNGFTTTLELEV